MALQDSSFRPPSPETSTPEHKDEDSNDLFTRSSTPQDLDLGSDAKQGAETQGKATTTFPPAQIEEPEWAHGFQLFTILATLSLVCFLMLLDGTIVVAAVPRITDDFNSLKDIGWYGAAYQLGRYVISSSKWNGGP